MKYLPRVRFHMQSRMWELFKDLKDIPHREEVQALEIIRSARSGSIKLNSHFNLRAYSQSINSRNHLSQQKDWARNVPLLPSYEESDSHQGSAYGVTESQIHNETSRIASSRSTFGFEDFSSDYRLEIAQSEVARVSKKYLHTGYNFAIMVQGALEQYEPAVDTLKDFLEYFPECKPVVVKYFREVSEARS